MIKFGDVLSELCMPEWCCIGFDELGPCSWCGGEQRMSQCAHCERCVYGRDEQVMRHTHHDDDGNLLGECITCLDHECIGAKVLELNYDQPSDRRAA